MAAVPGHTRLVYGFCVCLGIGKGISPDFNCYRFNLVLLLF